MGHVRIGAALPATRPWKEVVGLVPEGANVAQVAEATARALELALNEVWRNQRKPRKLNKRLHRLSILRACADMRIRQ
jgi:hypothetical protein